MHLHEAIHFAKEQVQGSVKVPRIPKLIGALLFGETMSLS